MLQGFYRVVFGELAAAYLLLLLRSYAVSGVPGSIFAGLGTLVQEFFRFRDQGGVKP